MTTPPSARPTTVKVPAWEYLVVGALIAASLGYSVACAFAVAAVHSLRSVAAQILAGEHPDLITIQARLHAESHAHAIVSGLGWLILVCYVAWSVVLHRRLQTAGQRTRPSRSRPWAYRIWLFAIVVSVIVAAGDAAGLGSVRTVADVHRAAGFDIALLVIRGALGLVYVWYAVSTLAARREFAPTPPAKIAGADLSYEEYVAMRAAQRAGAPTPIIAAATPPQSGPSDQASPESSPSQPIAPQPIPPSPILEATNAAAGEVAVDAPVE